ncbi:MAG: hypothetical protein SGARI_005958, partial [Bacillariaceae sp.]
MHLLDIPLRAQKGRAVVLLSKKMENQKTEVEETVQSTPDVPSKEMQPPPEAEDTLAKSDRTDNGINALISRPQSTKPLKESAHSKNMTKEDFMDLQLSHSASQFESPTPELDAENISIAVEETDKEPASAVSKVSPSSKGRDDKKSDEAVQNEAEGPSFNKGSTDDEE